MISETNFNNKNDNGEYVDDDDDNDADEVQNDTSCTKYDCCKQLHKLCQHYPCPTKMGNRFIFGRAGRRSLPPGWLCSS